MKRLLCFKMCIMIYILHVQSVVAQKLTPADVKSDLAEFRADLEDRFSYFWYNQDKNGYDATIKAIQAKADANNGMDVNDLKIELTKVIALFIDGHARTDMRKLPSGELPFYLFDTKNGVVAVMQFRAAYYEPDYPYITKIDNESIDEWIKRASVFIAKSSLQRTRYVALRSFIPYINMLRKEVKLPLSNSVTLEFKSLSGKIKTKTIDLGKRPPLDIWPNTKSKIIGEHNIGYLRLPSFSQGKGVYEIDTWMAKFKRTKGLVVDVRDNYGGSRAALRAILPYFMDYGDPSHVVNAGKYRLYEKFKKDHLGRRYMYRENSSRFNAGDKKAIQDFKKTFDPEWKAPEDKFSEWHYMVINKSTNPKATFFYNKPVVVLTSASNFSAADIFLSGLKGYRNIHLIGVPSGGGSARSKTEVLTKSSTSVTLASMISYQNNGKLYDLHGIAVDKRIDPSPTDLIVGGTDKQLDVAIADILERAKKIPKQYDLDLATTGNGSVVSSPKGELLSEGATVKITATPGMGWIFDGWSGDLSGNENPATVTMNAHKSITAVFKKGPTVIYYTGFESGKFDKVWTTKSSAPEGRIRIIKIFGPHTGEYHLTMDTKVRTTDKVTNEAWLRLDLSKKTNVKLNFWWKDYDDGNDPEVDGVFFSENGGRDFVQVLSLIDGTLSYEEKTLDVDKLAAEKKLKLTKDFVIKFQQTDNDPIPRKDGFGFDDIQVLGKDGERVAQYELTIAEEGYGTVVSSHSAGLVDIGTQVTLTAKPANGWTFDRWSGDLSGNKNPATVTMNAKKNITAVFKKGPTVIYYTGFESGKFDKVWKTKSSAPEGRIQITKDFGPHRGKYHLTMDTKVSTTDKVTNEGWLQLDLSKKTNVKLNFWWRDYNDANDPEVDGVFFSDNGGKDFVQVLSLIDGTLSYEEKTLDVDKLVAEKKLKLTKDFVIKFQQHEDNPIPKNDGFGFDDIQVLGKDGEKVAQYELTIAEEGYGTVVSSHSAGLVDIGTQVTLTAKPANGWTFDRWSGDLSGNKNPTTVTMNAKKNITAVFKKGPTVIYYTGFESGKFDKVWKTKSSAPEGRIQITEDFGPHRGKYHLTMDTKVSTDEKVTNEAWLQLDLSNKINVKLEFWWRDYNDANDPEVDGVFFSDNGGKDFVQVLSLIDGTLSYEEKTLDVDKLVAEKKLKLTKDFVIKFQQHEDNPIPKNDGFGFDDIQVLGTQKDVPTSIKRGDANKFSLTSYPNPFSMSAHIEFVLPMGSMVELNIYDYLGQHVISLVGEKLQPGKHTYPFDASALANGIYTLRLEIGNHSTTQKMICIK